MWASKIASLALEHIHQPYCWASFRSATLTVALVVTFGIFLYILKRPCVYLVDYSCMKYGDEHKASLEVLQYFMETLGTMEKRDIVFQLKVFLKSGIGEEAYVPRRMLEKGRVVDPQNLEEQSRVLIVGAVDELLKKTGVMPVEVDIVVVNSGIYNPSPSLTAWLVNHFNMRTDVKTYQLAGMGCSAGLIAVDLAKDLLYLHRNKYAVIASSEVMQYLYDGKERSMMVTNCLFRCAGSALLLSNKERDKSRAKLELLHLVRVNTAAQDDAHNCVVVKEDSEGVCGAQLAVKLVEVASDALRINIQKLAPKVLPVSELLKAGWNLVKRKVLKMRVKQYVPNFKLAFEHFCIHPGGKAVIEGVGKSLKLSQYDIEPSLMALRRFGNTSCAGVWYILAYCEAKKRLKRGDRVWQIGLGSGFKCTSGVWRVMRRLDGSAMVGNPWNDSIHRYPMGDVSENKHVQTFIDLHNKFHKAEAGGAANKCSTWRRRARSLEDRAWSFHLGAWSLAREHTSLLFKVVYQPSMENSRWWHVVPISSRSKSIYNAFKNIEVTGDDGTDNEGDHEYSSTRMDHDQSNPHEDDCAIGEDEDIDNNSSSSDGIDLFVSLNIGSNIEIDSLTRLDLIEDEIYQQ